MKESSPERKRVEDKELAHEMANASDYHRTEEASWSRKPKEEEIQPPATFFDKISSLIGISLPEKIRAQIKADREAVAFRAEDNAEGLENEVEYAAIAKKEGLSMDIVSLTKLIHRVSQEILNHKDFSAESWKARGRLKGLLQASDEILETKKPTALELEELRKIYFAESN